MQSASRSARPGPGSPRRLTNSIPPAASRPAGFAWMPARRRPSTPSSARARSSWSRPRANQRSRARFIAPGITHFPHVGADRCVCPSPVSAKTGAHAGAPLQDRRPNPMEGTARRAPTSPAALRQGPTRRHPLQSRPLPQSQQSLTGPVGSPSLAAMGEADPHAARNKVIFTAFCDAYPSLRIRIAGEPRYPSTAEQFPDVETTMNDGIRIWWELGEWLDEDQTRTARRNERLEGHIRQALSETPNETINILYCRILTVAEAQQ